MNEAKAVFFLLVQHTYRGSKGLGTLALRNGKMANNLRAIKKQISTLNWQPREISYGRYNKFHVNLHFSCY